MPTLLSTGNVVEMFSIVRNDAQFLVIKGSVMVTLEAVEYTDHPGVGSLKEAVRNDCLDNREHASMAIQQSEAAVRTRRARRRKYPVLISFQARVEITSFVGILKLKAKKKKERFEAIEELLGAIDAMLFRFYKCFVSLIWAHVRSHSHAICIPSTAQACYEEHDLDLGFRSFCNPFEVISS
ncbi:hypothetical protein SADUNF_Sadunf05G0163700 [Salix dunnii]|uniref:Uncharacterized protein n=1 Tax=Salix dunnii TaxID=1413687 RepID=A0A835MXX5_9ROSI|nr:hypothetical protein SADUNF_Sadunf05G0163700 [Salix dunnii]